MSMVGAAPPSPVRVGPEEVEGEEDASVEPLIAAEQVQALYRNRVLPYLVSLINAVVIALALEGWASRAGRALWLAVIVALAVARFFLTRLFHQARPASAEAPRWRRLYAIGIGANGIAWGALPLLFPVGGQVAVQALMSFVLGGMVAGATATANTDQRSFRAFAIPALLPMVATMIADGERMNLAMAVMLTLFGVAMAILARGSGRTFAQNARLRLRNERLVRRLAEARDLLERRVQERTAELRATLEEQRRAEASARQAVAARDQFLAVASHELLTPLSALQLQLRVMEQAFAADAAAVDARRVEGVAGMSRQVARMAALVDTVFRVSGLDRDQLVLEARPIDLSETVRAAVSDLEAMGAVGASIAPVALRLQQPLNGSWDPTRVEQIVVNLVTNAIKYGDGNPVTVTLEADPRDAGRALLTVVDQGCGIPDAELGTIFEKFHRGAAGRRGQGLGLGLFVVRQLVSAMGGEITVASTVGAGSTFRVALPGRLP